MTSIIEVKIGDSEIKKQKFHRHKRFSVTNVDIIKIVV